MALDLLEHNFSGRSPGDFILTILTIADKVEVHPHLQVLPEHVAGAPRLRELAGGYKKARDAAANHDSEKMAEQLAAREECQSAASIMAYHISMISVYKKDPTVLHNTGYELKQRAVYSKNSSIPPMPTKFTVRHGGVSGAAVVTVNKEQSAASMELELSEETPPTESSFRPGGLLFKCRSELTGLEPTKRYHFRIRYRGAGGIGPWSHIVTLIMI